MTNTVLIEKLMGLSKRDKPAAFDRLVALMLDSGPISSPRTFLFRALVDPVQELLGHIVEAKKRWSGCWGKIHAIKVVREQTGLSLIEAKSWVETHASHLY